MPDWIYAIIYGLVEGLTEFIPVSSTAHLLITEKLLGHHEDDVFNIVIQGGAVLAIIPLFWQRFSGMIFGLKDAANRELLMKLLVAFFITVVLGLIVDKKGFKLPDELTSVAWALLIGGVLIFLAELWAKVRTPNFTVTWLEVILAFGIGQIIAGIFPGASRSGTTIVLAMALGLGRAVATEFTFMLGVPTILGASAYKLFSSYKKHELHMDNASHVAIGFLVAALSSFFVVRWLIRYVQSHTFNGFAGYRVIVGVTLLVWLAKAV